MIGQVIGNYRVVSELGRGGMGMVYRAEHVQLGRPVALKMLLPQFSNDAAIVQRFFNEARAASAIDHPGIVEIFDFGTHTDGRAYIVMALLRGESLEQRLQRGGFAAMEGASIVAQVCGALAAAHARGIIHRDLKPDNIFLVPNELLPNGIQVKLLDFGIAKLADEQAAGVKTQTGALIGTPAYMSPEQCMGSSELDHRTDLYSIGCILFHVLCGRPPFLSDHGTGMMIAAHLRDPAPDPRSLSPHVPGALAAIVMRLLEKDPAARFQTASELRTALVAAGATYVTQSPASAEPYSATIAAPSPPSAPYVGPEAFGATTAGGATAQAITQGATTAGGAAAQVVIAATTTAPARKHGVWMLAGVVVFALGGAAVFLAVSGRDDGRDPRPDPVASAAPAVPAAPGPVAEPTPAIAAPIDAAEEAACPPGQSRRDDTHGHCCWPEQAWSTAKDRCVGAPRCPTGTTARAESCVTVTAKAHRAPPAPPSREPERHDQPTQPAVAARTFRLDAQSYLPGDAIAIRFPSPVRAPTNDRSWVTVVEAQKPASVYGAWTFVADGARSTTLKAPATAGTYEVRLHTHYPAKSTNVEHAVAFVVTPPAEAPLSQPSATPASRQRFTVATTTLRGGASARVRFAVPLHAAPGERFWITVVARGAADSSWGTYEYVPAGARAMKLRVPTAAGDYELRLHANYPKQTTNVVHRVAIRVVGD